MMTWHIGEDGQIRANEEGTIFTVRKKRGSLKGKKGPFSGPLYEIEIDNNPAFTYAGYDSLSDAMRGAESLSKAING